MANMLVNPNLQGWTHGRYFTDQEGKVGTIEHPNGWEFVTIPREPDQNKLPQSLHRDEGFIISAGYRAWEGGYVQRGVQLQANTRYFAKATIKADVNFPHGTNPDFTAITWRFRVEGSGVTLEQDWAMTSKSELKQVEEHHWVFQTTAATSADLYFMARSVYAGNSCDFWVYNLSLEAVSPNTGGATVPILQTGNAATTPVINTQPTPTIDARPTTTTVVNTQPKTMPTVDTTAPKPQDTTISYGGTKSQGRSNQVSNLANITGESGKTLADVLTNQQIDAISAGLRAFAAHAGDNNQVIIKGMNELADALERLKVTSVG